MFEKALLERAQRRSRWSWMGLVVQTGMVAAVVAVPMLRPEVLEVILPKVALRVDLTPAPPVEVEVRTRTDTPNPTAGPGVVRRYARVFSAPSSYSNPVATIIDAPDAGFLPFDVGSSRVLATGPGVIPGALPVVGPAKPPEPKRAEPPARPVRVGGQVKPPQILVRANPTYPPLAKAARISGVVKLEGVIARDGTVQQLRLLSGHPLLAQAALEAVARWRYTPTLLNGEPVEVIAPIEVNFLLSQ